MKQSELDFDFLRADTGEAAGAKTRLPVLLTLLAVLAIVAISDRDWTGNERRRIDDAASIWREQTRASAAHANASRPAVLDEKEARLLELRWVPRFTELENCVARGHQIESIDIDAEAEVTTVVTSMDKVETLQEYVSCLNGGLERPTWTVQAIVPASPIDSTTSGQHTSHLRATLRHSEHQPLR